MALIWLRLCRPKTLALLASKPGFVLIPNNGGIVLMSVADTLKLIQEKKAQFVDFRFTDSRGKEQHVSVPVEAISEETFDE